MSAGVARQYTGTAGRVENCQVGVFLAYAAPDGSRALIDRELYLPEKWASDRDRCAAAGIGQQVAFATKPQLAQKMIARAVNAWVPFPWVAADEVYGGNPGLRSCAGRRRHLLRDGRRLQLDGHHRGGAVPRGRAGGPGPRLRLAAAQLRRRGPRARGCMTGQLIGTTSPGISCWPAAPWPRARRASWSWHTSAAGHPAQSRCPSWWLSRAPGGRWRHCLAEANNQTGLDHYQVRRYRAWYRHITLSMLAHAFLAVAARSTWPAPAEGKGDPMAVDNVSPRPGHTPRRPS